MWSFFDPASSPSAAAGIEFQRGRIVAEMDKPDSIVNETLRCIAPTFWEPEIFQVLWVALCRGPI
jgi:hypothetical protein